MPEALQLLREDHNKVKQLFKQFEQAEDKADKQRIADEALTELEIHAEIEEEIFYPRMMKQPGVEDMMLEAEEEHAVAKNLIAELRGMRAMTARYEAKFTVLAEYTLHHVQEEEEQMFPKAAELGREFLDEAGAEMSARKTDLMQSGMPSARKRTPAKRNTGAKRATAGRTKSAGRTTRPAAGSRRTTRTTSKAATGTRKSATGTRKAATGTRKSATGTRKAATGTRKAATARKGSTTRTAAKPKTTAKRTTRSAATRARATAEPATAKRATSKRTSTRR